MTWYILSCSFVEICFGKVNFYLLLSIYVGISVKICHILTWVGCCLVVIFLVSC